MNAIFCSVVLSMIQGIAHTQLCYLCQKVGRYKMVSEHSVACRIEKQGLENHRTKLYLKLFMKSFYFIHV
jgi:hypothetical protein